MYLQTGECAITAKEPGSCYVFKITGVAHKDELDKEVVDWHASDEYFVRAQWFAVVGDNDTDDGAGSLRCITPPSASGAVAAVVAVSLNGVDFVGLRGGANPAHASGVGVVGLGVARGQSRRRPEAPHRCAPQVQWLLGMLGRRLRGAC